VRIRQGYRRLQVLLRREGWEAFARQSSNDALGVNFLTDWQEGLPGSWQPNQRVWP
jgi:hypothetical protein